MTTRLLLDEMLAPEIAVQLRDRGHDVVAVTEHPELCSTADEDLLVEATKHGRAIVTMNIRDFARIDADWKSQGRSHAGLVMLPSSAFPQDRRFIGRLVRSLDDAFNRGTLPGHDGVVYLRPPRR